MPTSELKIALLGDVHANLPAEMPLWPKLYLAYEALGVTVPKEWRRFDSMIKRRLESSSVYIKFLETYRRSSLVIGNGK